MEENILEFVEPYFSTKTAGLTKDISRAADNVDRISNFLYKCGKYAGSERLLQHAINWECLILHAYDPVILETKSRKGNSLRLQTRYQEAESVFVEVEKEYAAGDYGNDKGRVWNLLYLTRLTRDQGRFEEAENHLRDILVRTECVPERRGIYLETKNDLAWTLMKRSKLLEAEHVICDLIAVSTAELGHDHPDTKASMACLATVLSKLGQVRDSLNLYLECYAFATRTWGSSSPESINGGINVGYCLRALGRIKEAGELLREISGTAKRVFGPDHRYTVVIIGNLATCLLEQKQKYEGLEAAKRALSIQEKNPDLNKLDLIWSQEVQALALKANDQLQEAEVLLCKVLGRCDEIYGKTSHCTLEVTHNLGCILRDQNRNEEAKGLFKTVWGYQRDLLGEDHYRTLKTAFEYALLLDPITQRREVTTILRTAAQGLPKALDPLHPIHKRIAEAMKARNIELIAGDRDESD
ncbi:hypothetical protein BCR34DRAFT_191231 [Clohesyomyces aquaticus]|uniref:Tetratricopeptide repeat-domain-containing protein n=1 Tax=Clohesyomyces aquaticus TaxID=1231657 RepID=A0A1Y1ZY61_9PLEO|nr:hypothetical protein BCR34DRAFT_191231 [Clohesyomyces aquaticus]